jgi:CHRD domain-containing protein
MDTMKRLSVLAASLALLAVGCGSSSPSSPSTPTKPTFTATLSPSNEVPPISNAENTGRGDATVTLDLTKDAAGNVTAATATFVVNLSGFPNGTPINIAHIHQAPAGVNGSIVVNTSLGAGEVVLANGSGSFTKAGIAVNPVDLANQILANPAGFYFNVHSTLNPGGVARGQLVRTQ